jgi:hypothetical protein
VIVEKMNWDDFMGLKAGQQVYIQDIVTEQLHKVTVLPDQENHGEENIPPKRVQFGDTEMGFVFFGAGDYAEPRSVHDFTGYRLVKVAAP